MRTEYSYRTLHVPFTTAASGYNVHPVIMSGQYTYCVCVYVVCIHTLHNTRYTIYTRYTICTLYIVQCTYNVYGIGNNMTIWLQLYRSLHNCNAHSFYDIPRNTDIILSHVYTKVFFIPLYHDLVLWPCKFTMYYIHCTRYIIQFTMYGVYCLCTMYTVHCTMYSIHIISDNIFWYNL